MRQQHIDKPEAKKRPTVIDARTRPPVARQPQQAAGDPGATPTVSTLPVRTVVYVEVGDMDAEHVWELCRQYASSYEGSVHGEHYVIPVRQGRLRAEMEFESQFLETVHELCEVVDGAIVLRDGARDVQVMRTHVGTED